MITNWNKHHDVPKEFHCIQLLLKETAATKYSLIYSEINKGLKRTCRKNVCAKVENDKASNKTHDPKQKMLSTVQKYKL